MSGASFNGDLPTMTFGFSAQSDESRHMTLGLEAIKFLLEQDEDNVPIIQGWIDKWFWRGYRVAALVAAMTDYMLPKKFMSWKEAFELYFEEQMLDGLFADLAFYGIMPPRHVQHAVGEKDILSHQVHWTLYSFGFAAAFTTTVPEPYEMDWLAAKYPGTFDRYYRPVWERARAIQAGGGRFFFQGLPQLCQVCQIPMIFTEPGDPGTICQRHSSYDGERYDFCSDGCKWVFDREPEKYRQAWLPVHQIYQGNCGGPSVPEVLAWYGIADGDSGEYLGSVEHRNWLAWHGQPAAGSEPVRS
jgi:phenol hydroxylase P3 protein